MDFGNAALVHVRHLREMEQEFMSLPFQVCSSNEWMSTLFTLGLKGSSI